MNMVKSILTGLALLISFPGIALAHRVNIFAYAQDGMICTESYFNNGREAANSTVEIFDAKNNKLLLTGNTDENGEFSFEIPQAGALRIVLTASMGHKNEYLLSEGEVKAALGRVKASSKIPPESVERRKKQSLPEATTQIDNSQLEMLLGRVVEKKTAPIMKNLIKMEEQMRKPSISEILSGIGYILGLMGIGMYFRYRLKR